jgi:hypothetical protein
MSGNIAMQLDRQFAHNRRAFMGYAAGGVGALALAHLAALDLKEAGGALPSDGSSASTRHRRQPHHAPSADAVICLFQHGGPSQMDLFDPKPELTKRNGQKYDGDLEIHFPGQRGNVLGSPFKFQPHGQSGIELSEVLPHTAKIVDDMTLVRSVTTESVDHESALRLIHSGKFQASYPTWGSWVSYGLGTVNQNLPAYVVLSDPSGMPVDNVRNWTSGWLPAEYQGTTFRSGGSPVPNLITPKDVTPGARVRQLDLLKRLNTDHLRQYPGNSELEARISDFEIAARMQTAVPELLDLSQESEATKKMYGLDNPTTAEYGSRCIIARRLIERGVRFVQLFLASQPWDTHSKNAESLKANCARVDQPSAALVQDLKQRGLLDRTIVLWGGEFGRLPVSQGTDGRDHNRHANSLWLAGGGFQRGLAYGRTDDFGYQAVEDVVTVHDLHATLLHAMGLDHQRLTYPHDGRPGSLTDVAITKAKVIEKLLQRPKS